MISGLSNYYVTCPGASVLEKMKIGFEREIRKLAEISGFEGFVVSMIFESGVLRDGY